MSLSKSIFKVFIYLNQLYETVKYDCETLEEAKNYIQIYIMKNDDVFMRFRKWLRHLKREIRVQQNILFVDEL